VRRQIVSTTIAIIGVVVVACGGGGGGSGSCDGAGATVCDKACACDTDGQCHIVLPPPNDAGSGSAFLTYPTKNDCTTTHELVCQNSPAAKTVNFAACSADLAGAACIADPLGSGKQGLDLPQSCAAVW
jgi:hypothetical protein